MNLKMHRSLAFALRSLKQDTLWMALVLGLVALMTFPVGAKSVYLGAQFTSEEYWSSHAIYLARLTDIKGPSASNGVYVTSFVPIKIISGAAGPTNRSIQSYPGRFIAETASRGASQPFNFPLGVPGNGLILVSETMDYRQITVVRVMEFPEDQALWWELEQIASIRKDPILQALLAEATSPFDIESGYCLNRLLTMPDQAIAEADTKKLQALAEDEGRTADLRIAAEEAVLKFSGLPEPKRSDAEYNWLRGVIDSASGTTNAINDFPGYVDQMRPMFMQLFEFDSHRADTVDYVLQLVVNQNAPAALRDSACSALSSWDQKVFNFKSPDKQFERMFATYSDLLKDPSPDLRIMGVSMLFDRTLTIMATFSPPDRVHEYGTKAVQELQQALTVETDSRVKLFLWIYEDQQKHPRHLPHHGANTGKFTATNP